MSKNNEPQVYRVKEPLWQKLKKLLPVPKGRGRRPAQDKECFEAMIYLLRTGIQWKELPKDFPAKSTVHDRFQRWLEIGIFVELWKKLLEEYDEVEGLDWEWLSGDSSSVKSPLGGEKKQGIIRRTEASLEPNVIRYAKVMASR